MKYTNFINTWLCRSYSNLHFENYFFQKWPSWCCAISRNFI